MNLKNAYKEWQETNPDSYMADGKKRPVKWVRKLKAYKQRNKQAKCLSCAKLVAEKDLRVMRDGGSGYCCSNCYQLS